MTSTMTVDMVFDCPIWAFDEFQLEILGQISTDDPDFEQLRAAAVAILRDKLTTWWAEQGKTVVFLERELFGQLVTLYATGAYTLAHLLMPTPQESMKAWETVVQDITADEVRQSAGLA